MVTPLTQRASRQRLNSGRAEGSRNRGDAEDLGKVVCEECPGERRLGYGAQDLVQRGSVLPGGGCDRNHRPKR